MSDNELDNLFKEAAEGFTPPQDSNAWKQMAYRLDQHAVKSAAFWNWETIAGTIAIGLIAVTATWYGLTTDSKSVSKTHEQHEVTNATQGVVQEQKEQPNPKSKQNLAIAKSVEDTDAGTRTVDKGKAIVTTNSNIKSSESGNNNDNIGKADNDKLPSGIPEVVIDNQSPSNAETAIVMDQRSETRSAMEEEIIVVDSVQVEEKKEDEKEITETPDSKTPEEEKRKTGSGFSLKAVVSPDFSSVKFFSASKPGINYGLLAGYSFNNRWSVFTGVIYSKKLYESNNVEESYSWDGHDYPVKEIEGDCRILDIPVNVYYTFFPERSFSLRAGLGFSSYIMRKEDYVYCVDNYGNDVYYQQAIRGKNNEWFKVMNVSVAVSKKLAPRLSAEFEPFVKAPLAGVGEGKISLVSMGAFFNLKFDLTNK